MAQGWNLASVVNDPLIAPGSTVVFMPSTHMGRCGWRPFRFPTLVGPHMETKEKKRPKRLLKKRGLPSKEILTRNSSAGSWELWRTIKER
jgi:hypothetical protein